MGEGGRISVETENIHPLWKTVLINLLTVTKLEKKQEIYGLLGTSDHLITKENVPQTEGKKFFFFKEIENL